MQLPENDKFATLIDMAHSARHVAECAELDFMAVNATHALAPYRQAALWSPDRGVYALSGVVQIESNAPYVHWLESLCASLDKPGRVMSADVPEAIGGDWADWLPAYALWLPMHRNGEPAGGLLLAREIPWMDSEIPILTEWVDILQHAMNARSRPKHFHPAHIKRRFIERLQSERDAQLPWWRRRSIQVAAALFLFLFVPVRLTVLAPGELVPSKPAMIRSPLEGVIARFHVKPNELVKKGQPLFDFDEAQLASRYAVANQSLATAEAEYRQSAQQALTDGKSKSQLSTLQGKIEERRAEMEFLAEMVERAHVLAPADGIALFDDPSEWVGRPVATGERIMRIAAPGDVEIEAWVPVGDAIPLLPGAPASLYLSASPLDPVDAHVRYMSYDAFQRPDGAFAYRVRATLSGPSPHRVGLKGTAKLSGRWVPLCYWVFRRPLALARQTLGV